MGRRQEMQDHSLTVALPVLGRWWRAVMDCRYLVGLLAGAGDGDRGEELKPYDLGINVLVYALTAAGSPTTEFLAT